MNIVFLYKINNNITACYNWKTKEHKKDKSQDLEGFRLNNG